MTKIYRNCLKQSPGVAITRGGRRAAVSLDWRSESGRSIPTFHGEPPPTFNREIPFHFGAYKRARIGESAFEARGVAGISQQPETSLIWRSIDERLDALTMNFELMSHANEAHEAAAMLSDNGGGVLR